jgi:peptidyl-prolyl cis-trans isomerase C
MKAIEVNGALIPPSLIRAESARLRQEALAAGAEIGLDEAINFVKEAEALLIERVLLDQEADRRAITVQTEEIDAVLGCRTGPQSCELRTDIERRLRIDKLVADWTTKVKRPSANAIREAYRRGRESFHAPERVRAAHIVKNVHHPDERDPARAVLEVAAGELARGASFTALAEAHSDCPEQGGSLGFIVRGEMVPEFEEVVFALPAPGTSTVFETRFGFHIVQVTERKPAGLLDFSEAAPRIEQALLTQAKESELGARLRALHAQSSVRRVTV